MALRGIRLPLTPTELVLVTWFTAMSCFRIIGPAIVGPVDFGWDAVAYTRAARALLDGGNPWLAGIPNATYAAPPPSLLPFLPFAYLPEPVVQAVWVTLGIVSALYVFRRLRLPLWWFLFPPLLLAIVAGSSALPLVALLVRGGAFSQGRGPGSASERGPGSARDRDHGSATDRGPGSPTDRGGSAFDRGGTLAEAAAVVGRIYSAVPLVLLGRVRPLLLAGVALLVTAPFLAWDTYIAELPRISALLPAQSGGGNSALAVPLLVPLAVVGLVLVGRRRAAWLAVPALWPNAQEYYAVIALPVAAQVPLATLAMATPLTPGIIAVGLFAQGLWDRVLAPRFGRRPSEAGPLATTGAVESPAETR